MSDVRHDQLSQIDRLRLHAMGLIDEQPCLDSLNDEISNLMVDCCQAEGSLEVALQALEIIASRHVTAKPLWWQQAARTAIAKAKGKANEF